MEKRDEPLQENKVSRRAFLAELSGAVVGLAFIGCGSAATRDTKQEAPAQEPLLPTVGPESGAEIIEDSGNTFVFGKNVPQEQRNEIRDAVTKSIKWFSSNGIDIVNTSIYAFSDTQTTVQNYLERSSIPKSEHARVQQDLSRATAFSGLNRDFFIITTSPGWTHASPIIGGPAREGRYHTVAHELFHVYQRNTGAYSREPVAWMNEGIAHYLAALFLKETNIYSYEAIRNGHLGEAAKVPQPLSGLESSAAFYNAGNPQTADEYSLAFLAVEFLTRDLPNSGVNAVADYWKKIGVGQTNQKAFEAAFGKTPESFYPQFETFRQNGFKA